MFLSKMPKVMKEAGGYVFVAFCPDPPPYIYLVNWIQDMGSGSTSLYLIQPATFRQHASYSTTYVSVGHHVHKLQKTRSKEGSSQEKIDIQKLVVVENNGCV